LFSEKNFVFGEVALVMWMESNKEIFENVRDEDMEPLRLRVSFLASLWTLTSLAF
jgi:hypothetical protein